MIDYPEYAEVKGKKYKINTSYKTAIECNAIAENKSISDYERALAIIYKLFGDEGLENEKDHGELLKLAKKYLCCGKEIEIINDNSEKDMDFIEDIDYIKASFRSDYNIDLNKEDMHWWEFFNLINGLSNNEIGNCCVLNRIRNLRTADPKEIKDSKERQKLIEAQRAVSLKCNRKELTDKQKKSIDSFLEKAGLKDKI